jgi:hypothetical protein
MHDTVNPNLLQTAHREVDSSSLSGGVLLSTPSVFEAETLVLLLCDESKLYNQISNNLFVIAIFIFTAMSFFCTVIRMCSQHDNASLCMQSKAHLGDNKHVVSFEGLMGIDMILVEGGSNFRIYMIPFEFQIWC